MPASPKCGSFECFTLMSGFQHRCFRPMATCCKLILWAVSFSVNAKLFASSGALAHHVDQHYFCPLCTGLFRACNSVDALGKTHW